MAFHISVYRADDRDWMKGATFEDEVEAMSAKWKQKVLYENPLGSDGEVFEFWCVLGTRLGLNLVPKIYADGLEVEGKDLSQLLLELGQLEKAWKSKGFDSHTIDKLSECIGYLHAAIHIAQRNNAILDIG